MPTILYFADSLRGGRGATVRLDSGEPVTLSIAQSGVRVRKSRFGFFGPILYNINPSKSLFMFRLRIGGKVFGRRSVFFPDFSASFAWKTAQCFWNRHGMV